jgi:transposase-like protein
VASIAHDLGINDQTIYTWRRRNRGIQSGLTTSEKAELAAAKKRIAELETELQFARRAVDVPREEASPKGGTRRSR